MHTPSGVWRTEHVGSLLRPAELVALRLALLQGRGDPDTLRDVEDRAILSSLERQVAAGLDVVGDGEMRRFSFMGEVISAWEGFAPGDLPNPDWSSEQGPTNPGSRAMLVVSRLARRRRIAQAEAAFLREHASRPFKVTLPSPLVVAQACWRSGVSDGAYRRRADFMWEVAELLREDIRLLAAEGVPYLQLDNPGLAYYLDPDLRKRAEALGVGVDIPLEEAVAADAHALRDLPHGSPVVGLHVCRGNWNSSWLASGGLEPIAEALFSLPRVDRFLLEYDSPRAGGFDVLRHVPPDKTIVLGLVSTKHGRLEDISTLLQRVEEASRYVPTDRLALSPQCGFATSVPGNQIREKDQWAKIDLLTGLAQRLWG